MHSDKPLISVVTILLNEAPYIEETISSVINQTYDNIEYLVIDGGSTDGSLDIIKKYDSDIDYWTTGVGGGIYGQMNEGIKKSSGEYIIFINGGDRFFDERAVGDCIDTLNKKYLIVAGAGGLKYPDGFQVMIKPRPSLHDLPTAHHAIFFHRDIFKEFGLYDTRYTIAADFDLWQKIYLKAKDRVVTKDRIVNLTKLDGISSRKRFKVVMEKIEATHKNLSGIELFTTLIFLYSAFIRCTIIYILEKLNLYHLITHIRYKPIKNTSAVFAEQKRPRRGI